MIEIFVLLQEVIKLHACHIVSIRSQQYIKHIYLYSLLPLGNSDPVESMRTEKHHIVIV